MKAHRVVVLEVNELPPRVIRWHAANHPEGGLATLVGQGRMLTTENHDDLGERELYPSQAWATLNTGVPFDRHGIYWYGDPKPEGHPLYWQLAARAGRRVGIVGTLHSSPFARQIDGDVVFAIPDCFATDDDVRPEQYRAFQRLNLAATRGSGRVVSSRLCVRDAAVLATSWRLGVRPRSLVELTALGARVATRRVSRERLRSAQFVTMADIFQHLVRRHDPDLSVLFTNHVAAAMHRYWYAAFPQDWPEPVYDDAWVNRYRDEIPYALRLLDRTIAELIDLCDRTDRVLVLTTAMGQRADLRIGAAPKRFAVVRDPAAFVRSIGVPGAYRIVHGMVPQVGIAFDDVDAAEAAARHLRSLDVGNVRLRVDVAADVVTLTYDIDADTAAIVTNGVPVAFEDAGIAVEHTDDQRCAEHDPHGAFVVRGAQLEAEHDKIDSLHVAPALLDLLGVEVPAWQRHDGVQLSSGERVFE